MLLDQVGTASVCAAALGQGEVPTAPVSPSDVEATGGITAGNDAFFSPSGLLVLTCWPNNAGKTVIGFDVWRRSIAWQAPLGQFDVYTFSGEHLFGVSHTTTPPSGLTAAKTSYRLTAVDLDSGLVSWTVPFAADAPDSDEPNMSVDEGPSGLPAHPRDVVVGYLGTSAYDAVSGALLWHVKNMYDTPASGSYVTAGVVVGFPQNSSQFPVGYDVRTGAKVWSLTIPAEDCDVTHAELDGTVWWDIGRDCYDAYDVSSGKLAAFGKFPQSWSESFNFVATSKEALSYGGGQLGLYRMPDLTHPVWSVPADDVTPYAISSGHVAVFAQSGLVVLDATTGTITTTVDNAWFTGAGAYGGGGRMPTVEHGLMLVEGQYYGCVVMVLDAPTSS